ncbi:MAG: AraC family transcriptional regulator [Clostridiales bacterium]|nr:AraC family transcriptional regulator [Clostridiales bacterium]
MERNPTLHFCQFGPYNENENYRWGPGIQGLYVIHYVKKGRGFFETNGKRYKINTGESFIIYPEQIVKYYPDTDDPWEYCWVNFMSYSAKNIIAMTAFSEYPICHSAKELSGIYEKFLTNEKYRYAQVYNNGMLQILLAEYIRIYPAHRMECTLDHINYAYQCIDAGYQRQNFGVNELAQAVGVERSYLYRMFMEIEGISPKQFIIDVRMKNAVQMMERGVTSIQLISYSVGYEDPLYFSNAFKKKFGLSPKNYIKTKIHKNC